MHVSVDSRSPHYDPGCCWCEVYIDGVQEHDCYEADTDEGIAWCYESDENGQAVLDPETRECRRVVKRGNVELVGYREGMRPSLERKS